MLKNTPPNTNPLTQIVQTFYKNLENLLEKELLAIEQVLKKQDLQQEALAAAEKKLVTLVQVKMVAQALCQVVETAESNLGNQKPLSDIEQIEQRLQKSIEERIAQEQAKQFQNQLSQAQQKVLDKEKAFKDEIALHEKKVVSQVQTAFQKTQKVINSKAHIKP